MRRDAESVVLACFCCSSLVRRGLGNAITITWIHPTSSSSSSSLFQLLLTHPLFQPQRGLPPPHSPFFFLGVCAGLLTLLQWFV
jgi:hypothetical protein